MANIPPRGLHSLYSTLCDDEKTLRLICSVLKDLGSP